MPSLRKLDAHEVHLIKNKGVSARKQTAEEYDGYLADFSYGDYGEAIITADEKRETVRSRLKSAGERHDPPMKVTFRRTRDDNHLIFLIGEMTAPRKRNTVLAISTDEPKRGPGRRKKEVFEAVGTDAPPKRKPGRPKKNVVA